ncbi:hypothetical protein TBLA_0A08230 [Henningerozyma blattae CBS 6284]|uniref:Uncharacterized protein n=1 Tax=Henningerozyma blattae (strain ATCC 34711 / CBS 6284 / DSM 70876 / NBRC 10599 / NRRL Y-10934 / UCD 77-7) TaxID=1071380 RepID=I2GWW0_HENB6|nr:hypothetical protein TBLA_0A08230 [Tetrapisispora blattae CBS 6284]CCH58612.1 hypothetical protein TBLA_0A08230 [Tetrapisispora blattae CBS 6284]
MDFEKLLTQSIQEHKYWQFNAEWCKDCKYSKRVYEKMNIPQDKIYFFEISGYSKKEQSECRAALKKIIGTGNLPSIMIDGKLWGTEKELHELEDKGELQEEFVRIGLL